MRKSSASGRSIRAIGITLLLLGGTLKIVVFFLADVSFVLYLLPIVLLFCGGVVYFRGRQLAARSSAESVLHGERPKALYLRRFRADASPLGESFSAVGWSFPKTGMPTEEEQLAEALRPIGELIAIGRPSEDLPRPGATRLYPDPEEWQRTVIERMQTARLVVIRVGSGPGVLWELQKAREMVEPRTLLLLILEHGGYHLFRHEAETALGVRLPVLPSYRQQGFFRFTPNWTAEFLPLRGHLLRTSFSKPLQRSMQFALKPVFADYRVDWALPPRSPLTLIARLILILIAIILIVTPFPATSERPGEAPFDELRMGDCIQLPKANEARTVDAVPCAQAHDVEVFAVVQLHEQTWPSDTKMEQIADQACSARFGEYVGTPWHDSTLDITWFSPIKESWAPGRQRMLCMLGMPNGGKLVGSMKGAHR
jgi:Septum formation